MADGFGDIDPKRLRELRQEFQQLGADLTTIQKEYSTLLKNDTEAKELLLRYGKEEVNLIKDLSLVTKEQLKDRKITEKLIKKVNKLTQQSIDAEIKIQTTRSKINALIDQGASLTDDEVVEYQKLLVTQIQRNSKLQEAVKYADELVGAAKELDKNSSFFDTLANVTKSIPGISGATSAFEEAAEAYRGQLGEGGTGIMNVLNASFKGFSKLAKLAVKFLAGATVLRGIKLFVELDNRIVNITRNLNVLPSRAAAFNKEIASLALNSGSLVFNSERYLAALDSINIALGTAGRALNESGDKEGELNENLLRTFVLQTERLGISAESAAQLAQIYLALGVDSEDFNENLVAQVQSMNASNNLAIDYKDVMEDVKNINKATLLSMNQQERSIARSVFQAKKLGMTMSQIEGVADSLLNFESSIEAEMKAELLLGRQLNLEKARTAALNNDMAGVAEELAKQEITSAKFGKLNRIQQQGIAEAFGMSRSELGEILAQQEAVSKIKQLENVVGEKNLKIQRENATMIDKASEGLSAIDDEAFSVFSKSVGEIQNKVKLLADSAKDLNSGLMSVLTGIMGLNLEVKSLPNKTQSDKISRNMETHFNSGDTSGGIFVEKLMEIYRELVSETKETKEVMKQIRDKNNDVYINGNKVTSVLLNNDTKVGGVSG